MRQIIFRELEKSGKIDRRRHDLIMLGAVVMNLIQADGTIIKPKMPRVKGKQKSGLKPKLDELLRRPLAE
jgi:hypothetical protein